MTLLCLLLAYALMCLDFRTRSILYSGGFYLARWAGRRMKGSGSRSTIDLSDFTRLKAARGLLWSSASRGADIIERLTGMDDERVGIARGLQARTHLPRVKHLFELAHHHIVALEMLARRAAVFGIADILRAHRQGVTSRSEFRHLGAVADAGIDGGIHPRSLTALADGGLVCLPGNCSRWSCTPQ